MQSYVNGRVVQVPRSLRGKKKTTNQQSTFTTTTGVSATKGVWQSAAHLRQCRKRLEMSDNNNTRAVTALALRKREPRTRGIQLWEKPPPCRISINHLITDRQVSELCGAEQIRALPSLSLIDGPVDVSHPRTPGD